MRYLLKGKRMNFNDYIISDSDYSFFDSLPEDEKLLFMYDLICEESYGTGSENYEEPEDRYDTSEIKSDLAKFDDIVDAFKSKLQTIIAASISEKAPVNMIFLNDKLIINSESLALIADTINQIYDSCDKIIILVAELHDVTVDFIEKFDKSKIVYMLNGHLNFKLSHAVELHWLNWFETTANFYKNNLMLLNKLNLNLKFKNSAVRSL
jgi:hypothetical protein